MNGFLSPSNYRVTHARCGEDDSTHFPRTAMNQQPDGLRLTLGTPAIYCITILGQLSRSWSQEFGNLTIETIDTTDDWAQTTLTGPLPDQAALFGILNHLYGLGFPLVSVKCLAVTEEASP